MSDLLPITTHEMIAEIEREIVMRERVYPRWVADGKLKQAKADRQIAILRAAVRRLRELENGQ